MHLIFVSYESPWAPAGGIAAVMRNLPHFIGASGQDDVTIVTPFHHRIPQTARLEPSLSKIAEVHIPCQAGNISVNILQGDNGYLFLRPDDDRFFAGVPHPYLVSEAALRRDALLFGAAAWMTIKTLFGLTPGTVLLQDWHAATTALAACQSIQKPGMILTLHNSYDCAIHDRDLAEFAIPGIACPGNTALTRALPFVAETIPTVSDQFALDLLQDPLQTSILADHLTALLPNRITGINNGPFTELAIPQSIIAQVKTGQISPMTDWKNSNRKLALTALQSFNPCIDQAFWGDTHRFFDTAASGSCWFVMAGRDDTRQKGYDVAAEAVRSFLLAGQTASFFFFPIPGDEGLAGISYLEELAHDFPEHVAVFPFRWSAGFGATLRGASFGLMPSFYEPFGMANEFYLGGTPCVGRATGGIAQQIIPFRACGSFSRSAETIAARWHGFSSHPSGLLYRESLKISDMLNGWKLLNTSSEMPAGSGRGRLATRRASPLFQSMVTELAMAMKDACNIFHNQPLYCQMITAGIDHITHNFCWQRTASEYKRIAQCL